MHEPKAWGASEFALPVDHPLLPRLNDGPQQVTPRAINYSEPRFPQPVDLVGECIEEQANGLAILIDWLSDRHRAAFPLQRPISRSLVQIAPCG